MYWFQLTLVLAAASRLLATEAPQPRLVEGQSSAATCQQAPGAALLQQHVLVRGSRRGDSRATLLSAPAVDGVGESAEGSTISVPLTAELTQVTNSDENVIDTVSDAINVSSTDAPHSNTTSSASVSANSSTSTSNANSSVNTVSNKSDGKGVQDSTVSVTTAVVEPRVVVNGISDTSGIGNFSITARSTPSTNSSMVANNNASAMVSNGSSLQPPVPDGEDASVGGGTGEGDSEDADENGEGLPVFVPPSDERPSSVVVNGSNGTTPTAAGNVSITKTSTTRTRSSTRSSSTSSPSIKSSSTNSSVTMNITVPMRGRAETRIKKCRNGMCKVHNRTWHTSDSNGEAVWNPVNSTENVSNMSDVLKWLNDAFKDPDVWHDDVLGGPTPFSDGAGGFAPGGAQWQNWGNTEPDDSLPGSLNALSASLSEGFLQPWHQGREVGLSGMLPWGLRSRDLAVDQSGRDVMVVYHTVPFVEIRQMVGLMQVPRGEPRQIYDDVSGRFELRWPWGHDD